MCSNNLLDVMGEVFVAMIGNPIQGFNLVGPMKWTDARAYVESDGEPFGWIMELHTPAEMDEITAEKITRCNQP